MVIFSYVGIGLFILAILGALVYTGIQVHEEWGWTGVAVYTSGIALLAWFIFAAYYLDTLS
jgi:hypothetical protein